MADVETTQHLQNVGGDSVVDDGEEADSKVKTKSCVSALASNRNVNFQEILLMKQRVEEMEREAKKLRELQAAAEQASNTAGSEDGGVPMETEEDKTAADGRSIYVGNVGYSPP